MHSRGSLEVVDHGTLLTFTFDDLMRYHDKLLLIDHATLHVLGFNYTASTC